MIFEIKIQELRVANFTARVEADSKEEAEKRFEELNAKREAELKPGPKENLFDQLTETFTREQLNLLIEKQGKVTPDKVFINRWKKLRVIEIIDKNTFRKVKKGGRS